MIHFLDANTLIDASRDYYSFDVVPEFWEWLAHLGKKGDVKIPLEIYEELKVGNDNLAKWVKSKEVQDALLLKTDADPALVAQVINTGYASNLTDIEIEKIGRDPFLISYALSDPENHAIVTTERSRPAAQRANRRIPDICTDFSIENMHTFKFIRNMNFSTNWKC